MTAHEAGQDAAAEAMPEAVTDAGAATRGTPWQINFVTRHYFLNDPARGQPGGGLQVPGDGVGGGQHAAGVAP